MSLIRILVAFSIFGAWVTLISSVSAGEKWDSVRRQLDAMSGEHFMVTLEVLRELRTSGAPWNAVDQCRFSVVEAHVIWGSGDPKAANTVLVAAAELAAKAISEDLRDGWIGYCRGLGAYFRGNNAVAYPLLLEAAEFFRKTDLRRDLADVVAAAGEAASFLGLFDQARTHWLEARGLYMEVGAPLDAAMLDLSLVESKWPTAEEQQERETALLDALALFRQEEYHQGILQGTITLVRLRLLAPENLLQSLDEAEPIARKMGDMMAEYAFPYLRQRLYFQMEDFSSAVVHGRKALALAKAIGDPDYLCWATVDLGHSLLELGDPVFYDEAQTLLQKGNTQAEANGDRRYVAWAHLGLARIYSLKNDASTALQCAETALQIFTREDWPQERTYALATLSDLVAAAGDYARAFSLLREASEIKEAIRKEERRQVLVEAAAKFENELHDNALKLAQMEHELVEKRIDDQARALALSESNYLRYRWLRNFSIGMGVIATLLVFILTVLFLQRRRAQKRAERLNQALASETAALAREARQHEEVNRELMAANFRLKLLDEERKSLLGLAAHDMRNPVSAIQSTLDLLDAQFGLGTEADPQLIREYISLATEGSNMLLESIERIIQARRDQELSIGADLRRFDPRALIEQTVQLNQTAAARKQMRLRLAQMPAIEIEADPQALRTSVDNLISNAVKYSFPGALIDVRLQFIEDSGVVELMVEDTGPGIPEDEFDRLFQPFASLSNRPTGGERSTGLGLASVRAAVESMGGSVTAANRSNHAGARFVIRLRGCQITS